MRHSAHDMHHDLPTDLTCRVSEKTKLLSDAVNVNTKRIVMVSKQMRNPAFRK